MMKTNSFRKTLAILLSILLATPLFVLPTFAESFSQLSVYTDSLNEGDVWYNCRALATATDTEVYRYDSTFYLSEDQNTIKIEYTVDDTPTTELHTRSEDPQYFEYLRVMPAFGAALPTSPDGLQDGEYWFDVEKFVSVYSAYFSESMLNSMYRNATYYLSVDGTILRRTYTLYGYTSNSDELIVEEPSTMKTYLMQVGYDPNAGFTLLAKSADGLQGGEYWFDVASFVSTYGSGYAYYYENADYYLSDDTNTIRVYLPGSSSPMEWTRDGESVFFRFLIQVGVDPNAGFTLLPTTDTGLQDGAYWYDVDGLIAAVGNEESVRAAQFYLSDDGNTLRFVLNNTPYDYSRDSQEGAVYFRYVHQVGVDPNAGFTLLPTSDEGLSDGDYWYDAAGLAALEEMEELQTQAKYYLSDDGNTIRLITPSIGTLDIARDSDTGSLVFPYLRQVGVDPNLIPGFTLLPTSDEGLQDGDYWYDTALLAEMTGDDDCLAYLFYLSDDGNTLRIKIGTYTFDIAKDDENASTYFAYLRQVGVNPNPGFTLLPKSPDGLADGDYWYDAAGFAAMANDDSYLRWMYYLSEDGNTLRIMMSGYSTDITKNSSAAVSYFVYLHKVGESYTVLPTSADGLEDGAYWFDSAGLAAMTQDDSFLNATYSLRDDGEILSILSDGVTHYYMNVSEYTLFFQFLRQAGVDPNAGFTVLPTSEEGLAFGDWWYDEAGLAAQEEITGDELQAFLDALVCYLSEDGETLRIIYDGYVMDYPVDDEYSAEFVAFLKKATQGYTLLPTSEEGLQDGDYWFDAAGYAQAMEDEEALNNQYYISEDGTKLRVIMSDYMYDLVIGSDEATCLKFLRQVGVDPNAGYTLLPTSPDGLNVGDWWYDIDGLAAAENISEEQLEAFYDALTFYLSDDGTKMRLISSGYPIDFSLDDENFATFTQFLCQVQADPNAGFVLLPTSEEGLQDGDYWFDLDNLNNIADDEFDGAQVYLSEDGETLRFVMGDEHFNSTRDDEDGATLFAFLRQVGVDPNAGYTLLPTSPDGLNVGDLWFDAAGLAELEDDDVFLQADFYLGEDGRTLRIFFSGYPLDVAPEDEDYADVIAFLHRITDPGTAYVELFATTKPVSAGDTVVVTVDLTQNPGLAGMMLSLQYDTGVMTLTDAEAVGMMAQGNLMPGGDLTTVPFNILWDDATAPENHTETGTILKLTFKVKQTAVDGTTAVTMTYDPDSTFDTDLQNVPATIYGTSIKIVHHLPGDVDGDGEVTLMDVTVLTRYLAGGWDVTIDEGNCDVNGDGILDLKDVVLIRRFLAGGWNVELV